MAQRCCRLRSANSAVNQVGKGACDLDHITAMRGKPQIAYAPIRQLCNMPGQIYAGMGHCLQGVDGQKWLIIKCFKRHAVHVFVTHKLAVYLGQFVRAGMVTAGGNGKRLPAKNLYL